MKLTTGYEFQGYFITEYIDVIFDEILVGIGFKRALASTLDNVFSSFSGGEATVLTEKLNTVKAELRSRIVSKATELGANALIGIDFESSKLGDLMMVSMTATAVVITKIVSPLPITEVNRLSQLIKTEDFVSSQFIQEISNFSNAREMYEMVKKVNTDNRIVFDEEIMKNLESLAIIERMYGNQKKSFINKITGYFDGKNE